MRLAANDDLNLTFSDREAETRALLAETISRHMGEATACETAVPGLNFYRCGKATKSVTAIYEPCLGVIVRGRKRIELAGHVHEYDETGFMLAAIDLPVTSAVMDAGGLKDFLSMVLKIDLEMVREVAAATEAEAVAPASPSTGLAFGPMTPELLDALNRLVSLIDTPRDIPVMSNLLQREILYRVLNSSIGGRLRQIALAGTQSNLTARAIAWLRENFAQTISVEDLADISNMGVSTLHHHFRAMTAMSPLQYQKHLRLHEARRLMLAENVAAGTAAMQVGYESATQFSREYRRLFGAPPLQDIKAIRATAV
ncbi:AraC family transcriptional regulator [Alcaligenaceae bacterium C4P045]|nr:AraC family transcriptional regulator [Alcaligenaceae bacterium C4P045]